MKARVGGRAVGSEMDQTPAASPVRERTLAIRPRQQLTSPSIAHRGLVLHAVLPVTGPERTRQASGLTRGCPSSGKARRRTIRFCIR